MHSPQFTIDKENGTITIEKTFDAPQDKVWKAFTSGEILEKWWGPETWPATLLSFDFKEGGHWHYYMQGPDGTRSYGRTDYQTITDGEGFTATDSFTDESGEINTNLPTNTWELTLVESDKKTKMKIITTFANSDDLQTVIDMGFQEGFTSSLDNLDKYLSSN